MKRRLATVATLSMAVAFAGPALRPIEPTPSASSPRITRSWGKLPLAFEPNVGQADRQVRFVSHAGRTTLSLTSTGAVLSLPGATPGGRRMGEPPKSAPSTLLGMTFVGADQSALARGISPLPGVSNYFIGNDPRQWHAGVPHYAGVVYRNLYPGIDLTFYGNQSGHLEYDFTVRPGADPSLIGLVMRGTSGLSLGPSGDLMIGLGGHTLIQPRPRIYQMVNGIRQGVLGGYVLAGNRLAFSVGSYDPSRPLVIDPEVEYSTYLGGSTGGDLGEVHPAADDSGHVYICGETNSTDFPVTQGAYQSHNAGGGDALITEMNSEGTGLVYSTYFGGTGDDDAVACVLGHGGELYVGGLTSSSDFPTTAGAFQPTFGGGDPADCGPLDGYVAKLSASGSSLIYSTYVGGSEADQIIDIQADREGNVFAVGDTASTDFPTTPGAFQPSNAGGPPIICAITPVDHFVLKLNPAGSALMYSTYLGGPSDDCCDGIGVAIDGPGDAYVEGPTFSHRFPTTRGAFERHFKGGATDLTVSKLDPTGSRLLYSTYLGGSGDDIFGEIVVDHAGNAYVAGLTGSTDFPATLGAFQTNYGGGEIDSFATKLNPSGAGLVFSTYLGGSGDEGFGATGPLIDRQGHLYLKGGTFSTDFPVTSDAFQPTNHGGSDGTITELTRDGSGLIFSTYWGGSGNEGVNGSVLDRSGNFYGTGCTESTDFPTTEGAFQTTLQGGTGVFCQLPSDAFVTKIGFDEDDDQAKAVQRGPSDPPRAGAEDTRARGRWLLLGR